MARCSIAAFESEEIFFQKLGFAFEDTDEARDLMKRVFDWFGKYLGP